VLVTQEMGFGDAIQFSRFIPILRERHKGRIMLEVIAPLVPLFYGQWEGVEVAGYSEDGAEPCDVDQWIGMMGLPGALGITRGEDIPKPPYLKLPEGTGCKVDSKYAAALMGSKKHAITTLRNATPEMAEEIKDLYPGIALLGENPGDVEFEKTINVPRSYAQSAHLVASLERLVTVDTSWAHLAGALGLDFDLIPARFGEWRWARWMDWYPQVNFVWTSAHPKRWVEKS
jgi:hypothetical protein